MTVKNVSFDQLVAGHTNDFDLALAEISITPERAKVVDFSKPYFDSNIGVMTKKGAEVTEDNITEQAVRGLLRHDLGAVHPGHAEVPDTKIYPNSQTLYQSVLSGQSTPPSSTPRSCSPRPSRPTARSRSSASTRPVRSTARSTRRAPPTRPRFDQGISTMLTDGTLDNLSKTYLGPAFGGDPSSVPIWTIQ